VDYERSNFSVFQAAFPKDTASNIVSIYPIESQKHNSSPATGFKIGIAIIAVVMLALVVGSYLGYRHKQKWLRWIQSRKPAKSSTSKQEMESKEVEINELPQNAIEEVSGQSLYPEMDTGMVPEIDNEEIMAELPQPMVYEVSGDSSVSAQRHKRITDQVSTQLMK